MTYTCQNCGSTSEDHSTLCNPTGEAFENTFCQTSTEEVCDEKLPEMKFTCDECGGMSPDAEHLCTPRPIK